jgi:hypothetical protein
MRRLFARIRQVAPFLGSERGALRLARVAERPAEPAAALLGASPGADGRKEWALLDLRGVVVDGLSAEAGRLSLVSLRDARLSGGDLRGATLLLCDLSGAELRGIDLRGARLLGCDFDGAVLEDVDVSGAELRACSFRDAWAGGLRAEGARFEDVDFRHAAGITGALREQIRAVRLPHGGAWLYRAWARLLAGSAEGIPNAHRRVLRAVAWTWAALAFLVPAAFFVRAILHPVNPEAAPAWTTGEEPAEPPPQPSPADAGEGLGGLGR